MTKKVAYPMKSRNRIAGTKIIDRLVKHINGEIDMSPSQVQAARILLNKVLPDLKSMELQATVTPVATPIHELTNEELLKIASGGVVTRLPVKEKPVIEMQAIEAPAKK